MRVLADVNISPAVVDRLRERGVDAVRVTNLLDPASRPGAKLSGAGRAFAR